jgi:hypothetical protein
MVAPSLKIAFCLEIVTANPPIGSNICRLDSVNDTDNRYLNRLDFLKEKSLTGFLPIAINGVGKGLHPVGKIWRIRFFCDLQAQKYYYLLNYPGYFKNNRT